MTEEEYLREELRRAKVALKYSKRAYETDLQGVKCWKQQLGLSTTKDIAG